MGVMSKISAVSAVRSAAIEPVVQPSSPRTATKNISSCEICTGKIFWESIYRDGVFRCAKCEPAPGLEFVGRWIGLPSNPTLVVDRGGGADGRGDGQGEADDGQGCSRLDELAGGSPSPSTDRHPTLVDLSDLLTIEGRMLDGRRFYARRGWDNPRSPWFSQRLCMAVGLACAADSEGGGQVDGCDAADRLLDRGQLDRGADLQKQLLDSPREMKRIADAGGDTPAS